MLAHPSPTMTEEKAVRTDQGDGYCPVQDDMICYVFIYESKNPKVGAGQKKKELWQGVTD